MQIFNQFDIVIVPFPFTDKGATKRRPALVISQETYQQRNHHCILAMITSAKQSQWENDVIIQDLKATELPGPSVIRPKLFTLDERLILHTLGSLSHKDQKNVQSLLKNLFIL